MNVLFELFRTVALRLMVWKWLMGKKQVRLLELQRLSDQLIVKFEGALSIRNTAVVVLLLPTLKHAPVVN